MAQRRTAWARTPIFIRSGQLERRLCNLATGPSLPSASAEFARTCGLT